MREWGPSIWGRRFTGSGDWTLQLDGDEVRLAGPGLGSSALIRSESPVSVVRGIFWSSLSIKASTGDIAAVDGIPNRYAAEIADAIQLVVNEQLREEARAQDKARRATRRECFLRDLTLIQTWRGTVLDVVGRANSKRLWITQEQTQTFIESRPVISTPMGELDELMAEPEIEQILGDRYCEARKAIAMMNADLHGVVSRRNESHVQSELNDCRALFDRVESRPLTDEQRRAAICFENRLLVVAAAGSGKTSTIVAKACYALQRSLMQPSEIILLAFNQSAAKELQDRMNRALGALGMVGVQVSAKTFHALGIQIIGDATGAKPKVPTWASDEVDGLRKISDLVDYRKDKSGAFRTRWDMFRLVFGHDAPIFSRKTINEGEENDLRTLKGERVKSFEECLIANWLFYNGVNYEYEARYEFNTATARHSQYHPDFFYPELGLYHEHYALDQAGRPPADFEGYLEGVEWKRAEHARRGTQCIETTSADLWTGKLFKKLATELETRGVVLQPNPDRPLPSGGSAPLEHGQLVELIRCFIRHAKSNGLDDGALRARLKKMPKGTFAYRQRLFLDLVAEVREAWDSALAAEGAIDFEDMLNQAAGHLEAGRLPSPYKLVLADEFQDASWARARLCLALVRESGRHLCAVGDDWQSVNRFAGADVSVMTGFREWCGVGSVLRLEESFRCSQRLCDIAGHFVSKNPAQLSKTVRSSRPHEGPVVQAFQVVHRNQIQGAVREILKSICRGMADGTVPRVGSRQASVFVLGRYRDDEKYVPADWHSEFGKHLDIRFCTMHASKGSEADYVILPGMVARGFPNLRKEDSVLSLAMPGCDLFPLSEERRLLYVAFTRARRSVALITVQGNTSPFLRELCDDGFVTITDIEGVPVDDRPCPRCGKGELVPRSGRYGPFLGCSNYSCRFTRNVGK